MSRETVLFPFFNDNLAGVSTLAPRTPADFLELGFELMCYCQVAPGRCRHSGAVTMERLAEALGPGFDLYERRNALLERLVCSVCGARRPATILSRVVAQVSLLAHPPPAQSSVPIEEATRLALGLSAAARAHEAELGFGPGPQGRRVRKFGRR